MSGVWPVLEPVPGDAPGVRALADALEASGQRLADACTDLVRLRDGAVWDGPGGSAFGARIGPVPTVLDRAARRHVCAAAPLRAFADVLEVEQAVVQRAVEDHAEAGDRYLVLEDRAAALVAAGRDETSSELLTLRALQREQVAQLQDAEQRHRAATERLHAADGHCARVLRGLADDELADGAVYRGLRGASGVGHGVGSLAGLMVRVAPPAKPVAVAGDAVGLAADGVLLVGYGEGSGRDLAVTAGASVLGVGGDALRTGAKAGAVLRADGAAVPLARLSAQERIVLGMTQTARERVRAARSMVDVDERATASALVGGPALRGSGTLRARTADAARRLARERVDAVRSELALASAGGRSTQRLYGAGVTLTAASRSADRVVPADEERPAAPPPTLRGAR
ncbi:hypothetical protein [Phycicoccus flavus]|uniref:hypothetical protein n=1 Tax=Phycicoccus flavus TaxID=2502783 RepID=UPI000FEB9B47|nr:hypothetical protein [Phycicoccus flavus]NHA66812.1 hypothetical protein [Phycicoccus flavus]